MKKALITGATGQDGTFLSKLLLEKDLIIFSSDIENGRGRLGTPRYLEDALNLNFGLNDTDKQE